MKKNQKYSGAAGIAFFILAALLSISLLLVAADFGGINPARNTFFYSVGKILTSVYGFTSLCIPLFLLIAGIQCFNSNWRIRNGVLLVGSIIPFFTLDALEHVCRIILSEESGSVLLVKFSSAVLIGILILAAEYLLLSILGDVLENSFAEVKDYGNDYEEKELMEGPEADELSVEETEYKEVEDGIPEDDEIFLEQKEILKDLINDGKSDKVVEKRIEETTITENPAASEVAAVNQEPEIVENEDFDDSAVVPESVEEDEILNEEDFSDSGDTIVEEKTIIEEPVQEEPSPFEHIFDEQEKSYSEKQTESVYDEIEEPEIQETQIEEPQIQPEQDEEIDFVETEEEDNLIAEMNRVYSGESNHENETVRDIALTDEDFQSDDDMSEMQPIEFEDETEMENEFNDDADVEDEIEVEDEFSEPADNEIFEPEADEISEPVDDGIFEPETDEFVEPETEEFEEPETEEIDIQNSIEEDDESDIQDTISFDDENPADEINIEDIAEDIDEESEDDSFGIEDIFSQMEADANAHPVIKNQPAPATDSLYQPEEDVEEEPVQEEEQQKAYRKLSEYKIPTDLLEKFENDEYWRIDDETKAAGENLKQTLNEFGIEAEVTGIRKGPVVTMFEILPAPGVKLSKIVNLQDNIALALAAKSVRIVAPIPGKHAVGIEIPNKERAIVSFREIIEQNLPDYKKMAIPVILGKDISGQSQIIDIAKTPHLLIAGATGAGKSVCVNSIILSILYNRSPRDVKLIMVDPKVVELKLYNDIPHLLTPVVTEPKRALQVLQYCICEMERRYALLDGMGVRDIASYNTRIRERKIATEKLPYIVVIIDEFADLMATSGKELETNVARLTAMSRAVGIHLVLATQRPSVNVITGLIKANIPSRIAFMVASRTDSNIIIDATGAEKLLGKGDMLYTSAVNPIPTRIQGTLVGDNEVERVVEYVKSFGGPDYIDDEIFVDDDEEEENEPGLFSDGEDPLYDQALQIVVQTGKASASYLQRRLKIGYNRAARLVEDMEARGIVGPANGSKPREVIHVP
ncbi:DNA translocase FtsK [Treponema sp.]|uniref:DNA translocase FtsK n=1 Tax=Treponema sp. TaxID=166 RepID=UPI00388FF4BB